MRVIGAACEALEKEGVILPVHLRNMRDAKRIGPEVELLKKKMGMK